MNSRSVLVVDDDEKLAELLREYLEKQGWKVSAAHTTEEGLRIVREAEPDLVVLDVMIPEKNGFEACRELRTFSSVPVIMLTARGEVTDRVVGLELGADDYLSKPFEARELLARMESVLRRVKREAQPAKDESTLRFGELVIDLFRRLVTLKGAPVDLTTAEFDVLTVFAKSPGEVLDRTKIMDRLRGIDWQAYDRSIDVLISRIRQKLQDDAKRPTYLKTVWGVGYAFVGKAEG